MPTQTYEAPSGEDMKYQASSDIQAIAEYTGDDVEHFALALIRSNPNCSHLFVIPEDQNNIDWENCADADLAVFAIYKDGSTIRMTIDLVPDSDTGTLQIHAARASQEELSFLLILANIWYLALRLQNKTFAFYKGMETT